MSEIIRVALMASGDRASGGGGSTAEAVARDTLEGRVAFKIGVVVCNNPRDTVAVYDRFDALNIKYGLQGDDRIDVVHINGITHPGGPQPRGQTLEESEAIEQLFVERDIGFVSTVGYMKQVNGILIEKRAWKPEYGQGDPTHNGRYHPNAGILNNHPAILPFTRDTHSSGTHDRAAELRRKKKITHTAMTYHLVEVGIDTGPVIREIPIEIYEDDTGDTLGERVRSIERQETGRTIGDHLILRDQHLRNI